MKIEKLPEVVQSAIVAGLNDGRKLQVEFNNKTGQVHLLTVKLKKIDLEGDGRDE